MTPPAGEAAGTGLASSDARSRLERYGPNDVTEERRHPVASFARKFWGLSAWMLELIAILSFFLHKLADVAVALTLLLVNAVLGFLQEERASAAVRALRRELQVTARVLRDASWQPIPARDVVPGDVVRLRAGDFVPADVRLLDGELGVDQAALTGESGEVTRRRDEVVYSGSVVRLGEASGTVVATGSRTYYGRTTQLVASARPKLHVEEVVTRVVKWLFVIVGVQVGVAVAVSLVKGIPLVDILPLSLVLLMSAVPVALPVMFTVSMAVGSVELARRGVLITRLSAAEDAAHMNLLCVDKTGTLTANQLAVADTLPAAGFAPEDVLRDGALASNEANQDPIDLAFLRAARERGLLPDKYEQLSFVPFSPGTRRTEAVIRNERGTTRVVKGALRSVAEVAGLDSGAVAALERSLDEAARKGFRALAVARGEAQAPPRFVGLALLYDAPRPDSRQLIDELRSLGVAVKMVTGDALPVAQAVARELAIGDVGRLGTVSNDALEATGGFAEVFPEDKYTIVERLQSLGHVVGMTGDGVNDAPALRQAEVGIAVSAATDVAKAAASVVLTTPGLVNIIDLVRNGRAIYQRVLTWIVNKVSRTILKSGFVVVAFLVTGKFVISALGMVLLVFLTDFVKIALATDRVRASARPESWNIGPLIRVAVALGVLMLLEALGLLALAWNRFGLAGDPGRRQTFAFLTLLFFALFSILSIRERHAFWASRPGGLLALALGLDGLLGIVIGFHGLADLRPLPPIQTAVIISYAFLASLVVNDFCKRILIERLPRSGPMLRRR